MEYIKKLHLIIWEGVLITGNRANGLQFFLRISITPTPCSLVKQNNIKKCGLHLWRTVYLHSSFQYLNYGTILNGEQGKPTWERIMLIRTFVLKVINNERKKLTHHEIIDRIAEQMRRWSFKWANWESKLRIQPNLRRPHLSFTYSFKFPYKCFVRSAFHKSYER